MSETMKPHHCSSLSDFDEINETYGNDQKEQKFDLSHYLTPELSNEVDALMNVPHVPYFHDRFVKGNIKD